MQTEEILERLECVSGEYPQYMARCPAHNDNKPSLSIRDEPDRTLIYCFARLQCRRNYECNRVKAKRFI